MSAQLKEIVAGLYEIGPTSANQDTFAYFLMLNDVSPPEPPTLEESWSDPSMLGWYVFLPQEIADGEAETFVEQGRQLLPQLNYSPARLNTRAIVWLASVDECAQPIGSIVFYQLALNQQPRAPIKSSTFSWSGFAIQVATGANVGIDLSNAAFQFTTAPAGVSNIQVLYNNQPQWQFVAQYNGSGWLINVPLLGPSAGSLCFSVGMDWGRLCRNFDCVFEYFYPSAAGYSTLVYPLYLPKSQSTYLNGFLGFNNQLHPLYQTDCRHTRLGLDLSGTTVFSTNSQKMSSSYFQTVNGGTVTLIPHNLEASPPASVGSPDDFAQVPAGFGFCKQPAEGSPITSPADYDLYLAPVGAFRVVEVTPPSGPSQTAAGEDFQWMCGLFAQEFLQAEIGDVIEFVNNRPAWAPGFTGADSNDQTSPAAQALEPDFTTSWALYPGGYTEGQRGYFAQPSSSVYFAAPEGQVYPTVVNALLSTFPEPVAFPLVPYANIYNTQAIPYNQDVSAGVFEAFESAVLSKVRHAQVATSGVGPIFLPPVSAGRRNPLLLLPRAAGRSDAATMQSATTPQGLIANLNDDGTWNNVLMARGADDPSQYLSFQPLGSPPQRVSTALSNVLLQNQLFLVVSRPAPLGNFDNELTMTQFNFQLDIGPRTTILIFKYNTSASLKELVAQPSLWAESSTFVGDDLQATQKAILDYIKVAEDNSEASGDPFGYFNSIAKSADWTGILAMNCAINGNGMPPDLTMLLGGIPGQLRAHHFGIQTNRVTGSGSLQLDQSSLFGLIYYKKENQLGLAPPSVDFQYAVETLSVVFSNSKITQFVAQVGLTINRLFGRDVKLISEPGISPPPPPNTLEITGQYQNQDGVGTLTFVTDSPILYEFPIPEGSARVLDHVVFNQASLVPVGTGNSSPEMVEANFSLSGQLWFNPAPFPNSDGLDIFSYGTYDSPPVGMAFSGLVVNIRFALDAEGATVPGSEVLALQPSLLSFTPTSESIRPGSLLDSLPLQLSRFWYSPQGLSLSQLGAMSIHVLQLEGRNKARPDGSPGSPPPPVLSKGYPYVTTTPQFALEYDLPLGSLGSLSDVHAGLMAKLLLAWGPSQVVPDIDAAAVLVQLPQVMAGYGGFTLQGILRTTFGDANLLKVDLPAGPVYAILFNNIKLSIFGYSFPPGIVIDFTIFAGQPEQGGSTNTSNIAWFLAAMQPGGSPAS